MKDEQEVMYNNKKYTYNKYYKRLENINGGVPEILCPKCLASFFQIEYGIYECIAICNCEHKMVIYDG